MKKIVSLLLAAVMLIICAPMAAAQRSLSNPEGEFALPEMDSAWTAGTLIFGSVFEQMLTGRADPRTIMRLMEQAPLVREGDELPPRADLAMEDLANFMVTQGLRGICVALRETRWPDMYQFIGFYNNRKGETRWTAIGAAYNARTGLFHSLGEGGHGTDGLLGMGYEYEAGQQLLRTNAIDSWQRSMGYSILYDIFAPALGCYIGTLRFPFEYDGRDYMVQFWRGIYGWCTNGGEIGIYEKPLDRPVFWDCSDTRLDISMRIYRGGEMLFDYGTQHTWWLGGFRIGSPFGQALPHRLGMAGSIVFEDPAMLEAFLASFEKNRNDGITGAAQGMTFSFEWGPVRAPHSKNA